MKLPIEPMGKPRATRRDKWNPRPRVIRYRTWADALRALASKYRVTIPDSGCEVTYHFPMPASWSKKKREAMRGQPHQVRPDIDNCDKALLDVLRKGTDAAVWRLGAREKRWADEGAIEIGEPLAA